MPNFSIIVTIENYLIFSKTLHSNESQKWKSFSQNFQITFLKREKRFLLIFIDLDVKYCILKKTIRNSITGSTNVWG